MANLGARQADLATAVADLKTVIVNCTTDIAAADSDSDAIRRVKEIAQSALESMGFNQGDFGAPAT
jgi:hypothetical protein